MSAQRLQSVENPSPAEQRDAYHAQLRGMAAERHAAGGRSFYHREIARLYGLLVPQGASVLMLGAGDGGLLAALRPAHGVGVEIEEGAAGRAQQAHPELRFRLVPAYDRLESIEAPESTDAGGRVTRGFDFILLPDVVVDLWDVQATFAALRPLCHPGTRIIINSYSRLWQGPLSLARRLGVARPRLGRSWLDQHDVINLLALEGFECFRQFSEILLPLPVPLVQQAFNRVLARLWPLRWLCLTNFWVARPLPSAPPAPRSVSVVVPARNEAGNVRRILEEIPEMGAGTEIILVEGNSTDDTWETIQRTVKEFPQRRIRIMQQPGKGKGDAVRTGYAASTGDILMILDADLTVPAADLSRFYQAMVEGRGDFINGVRLVYPMQDDAMRFLNLLANKFFALAFSWVLGQPIKDTLCGTKVLSRRDYDRLAANRAYFGEFDPFGDFDLIFGAAKLNLRMVDLPIRYQNRVYGTTNISRWRHGMLLLRMLMLATRRLKFA